ncbi:MAG: hypothetical protein JNL13_06285 [Chitinophagaceae bacterium]|nr:hypothetical protein [Chitinophagaceae bacterium]
MKKKSSLLKALPIVAFLCVLLATAACNSNKKYGCPNHLKSSFSIR